jgi:prophage regulatory protein
MNVSAREKYADMAFLRAEQISWNRKKTNVPLLPISRSSFMEGVRVGKYPQPIKIGKISVWPTEEIMTFLDKLKDERGMAA